MFISLRDVPKSETEKCQNNGLALWCKQYRRWASGLNPSRQLELKTADFMILASTILQFGFRAKKNLPSKNRGI